MSKTLIYISICILSWSLIPVASKEVLKGMNNFAMLFFSNLISATVMLFYLIATSGVKKISQYSLKEYLVMSSLGFLGSFSYYILLYKAFSLSLAQEVFIINYTWPILIVIFSVPILNEKLSLIKTISVLISFIGVLTIITKGHIMDVRFTNVEGDILALLGAVCFALFSTFGKKVEYDQIIAIFVYFASATIFCTTTIGFFKITELSGNVLFWLFINGLFINGISYIFWFKALKSAQTSLVSNLVYLTPALSLIFISIFLKEKIHTYSLAGLILILLGIGMQMYKNSI